MSKTKVLGFCLTMLLLSSLVYFGTTNSIKVEEKRVIQLDSFKPQTKVKSVLPLISMVSDSNQGTIEKVSTCTINFMRDNGIELIGRETLISDPNLLVIKYDFDKNLRFYWYIARDFRQGFMDSVSFPSVIDQLNSVPISGALLGWGDREFTLTTGLSSDYLNDLPPGLITNATTQMPICLPNNSPMEKAGNPISSLPDYAKK